MKKAVLVFACLILAGISYWYFHQRTGADGEPPKASWELLQQQSTDLLEAVKKQDIHHIHVLATSVQKEVTDFESLGANLPTDQRQQFLDRLKEISTDAGAIHHDAHHAEWDDALIQHAKLVEVIRKMKNTY